MAVHCVDQQAGKSEAGAANFERDEYYDMGESSLAVDAEGRRGGDVCRWFAYMYPDH